MDYRSNAALIAFLVAVCVVWMACAGGSSLTDFDGDGAVDSVDCEPENEAIYPGASEDCQDEIDNNCDGWIDCQDNDCREVTACPEDSTGDDDDTVSDDDDSAPDDDDDSAPGDDDDSAPGDDDDSAPGDDDDSAPGDDDDNASSGEICANGFDDDANGLVDCADPYCFSDPACNNPGASDPCCTPSSSMDTGNCHDENAAQDMCTSGQFNSCCMGQAMWDQTCVNGYVQNGASCP